MQDVMMKNQLDDWIKIHKNPDDCEDLLKKVLSEYTAVTDNPGDTPGAWVKSANESILRIIYESFFSNTIMNMLVSWMPFVGRPAKLKMLGKLSMDRCSVQGFHPDVPENREQFYEDWNEWVISKVPKEQLLVFN